MAEALQLRVEEVRGTLRFFDQWLGRPHDNIHSLMSAANEGDTLVLLFDEGEELRIERPRRLSIRSGPRIYTEPTFTIASADRVLWSWFYYGRPHTPENWFSIDYRRVGGSVEVSSSATWFTPNHQADPQEPAVRLY